MHEREDPRRRKAVRPVDESHPDEHDPLSDGVRDEGPEETPLEDVTPEADDEADPKDA